MPVSPDVRKMTVIAQDPFLTAASDGQERILTTQLEIPYEDLGEGPRGYRVMVVDYDSSRGVLYDAPEFGATDEFVGAADEVLLRSTKFHAQNVYAIIMWLLSRFEFALGRRVAWGFLGPQLYVAPHAFYEPNAYYSEEAHGVLFGYFRGQSGDIVNSCLSHDIIAHEATHALLDGLRDSYDFPSGPDQAGFHEGFADTVALLSVFAHQEVVEAILRHDATADRDTIAVAALDPERIRKTALASLAEQFGRELGSLPGDALRNSVKDPPPADALETDEYVECHLRGEVLTAAMINAFIGVWQRRLEWTREPTNGSPPKRVSLKRAAEDGCDAALHLLTMATRALDYCPVVDITYGDFLSALLTADYEVLPTDGKYEYRKALREQFARWHIQPASHRRGLPADVRPPEAGMWERPEETEKLNYDCVHHESLQRDPEEVFRFIWENRKVLGISDRPYTRVISVRPCQRIAPDGFALRETVCEYRQIHELPASRLYAELRVKRPAGIEGDAPVRVYGGGVLVFNEFGRLKYHIRSRVENQERQQRRLNYLWKNRIRDKKGRYGFPDGVPRGRRFAAMHERRMGRVQKGDEWNG